MASYDQDSKLFKCSLCEVYLDLQSKTLSCLHSFCRSCLDKEVGYTDGENGRCPKCQESVVFGRLSFPPIVTKTLRKRQLETTDKWRCDICPEGNVDFLAQYWCHECQNLLCSSCNRIHLKYKPKHVPKDFRQMKRDEAVRLMAADLCHLHLRTMNCYCKKCEVCLCDACYKIHLVNSRMCSSQPSPISEEASRKKSQEGSFLANGMYDLGMCVRKLIEKTKKCTDELKAECTAECLRIKDNFEEMHRKAKKKQEELCREVIRVTEEQVRNWRRLLDEHEKILKELDIWQINLQYLLSDSSQDMDVPCGLQALESKLLSRLKNLPADSGSGCHLSARLPECWSQLLQELKQEQKCSVLLTVGKLSSAKNVGFKRDVELPKGTSRIGSIHVTKENDHLFLCEIETSNSITQYDKNGAFVNRCLFREGREHIPPYDICSIPSDIFLAVSGWVGEDEKIVSIERAKNSPVLEITNIFSTKRKVLKCAPSLCQMDETIFICDSNLKIDSFTKDVKPLKTIKTGRSEVPYHPRIRANPKTRNIWLLKDINSPSPSELCSYDKNGQEIQSLQIEERISDFCFNEFGMFFCNEEELFSFYPEKKTLYTFNKRSEASPKMFISENKIFIYLQIDKIKLIKIFGIID